jgi:uncharacterized membrane protein YhaH (DUF805 family)
MSRRAAMQREPSMNIVNNYIDILTKHYFDFEGRTRRSVFWYFFLANIIIAIVLNVVDTMMLHLGGILGMLYALATLLPGLGIGVRRLHDTNHSGWWLLIALIPLVGAIVLIVFYVQEGTKGQNQFGADPKA